MSDLQEQVQRAIDELVESGAERGIQVAVYRGGERIVGPGMARVAASHLGPHGRIAAAPETRQIARDLHRPPSRRQQLHHKRNASAGDRRMTVDDFLGGQHDAVPLPHNLDIIALVQAELLSDLGWDRYLPLLLDFGERHEPFLQAERNSNFQTYAPYGVLAGLSAPNCRRGLR